MFSGYRVQFYKMRRVLELDVGDGYTTLQIYLIPLHCTFENGLDGNFCYVKFTTINRLKKESNSILKEIHDNLGGVKLRNAKISQY